MTAKRALKSLERERDQEMLSYHEEKKLIEQEENNLLTQIEARLETDTQSQVLFEACWELI